VNQSVKATDIAVETSHPELLDTRLKRFITVHKMNTTPIREMEADTIIILAENGRVYDKDYIKRVL
jgi:hypothetical protein